MKINKDVCPLLFGSISFDELKLSNNIDGNSTDQKDISLFEQTLKACRKKTMYISKNVIKAFDTNEVNVKKLTKMRNEIENIDRCVIWNVDKVTTTSLYHFTKYKGKTIFTILWQHIDNNTLFKVSFHTTGWYDHNNDTNVYYASAACSSHYDKNILLQYIRDHIELIVQCEVFLQYAHIETKIIDKNNTPSIICKYTNHSKHPVTIVDSSWYTNLVVSGPYKVSGHFRLQPFGEANKSKKLIWINEYSKNGYYRKAKVLCELLNK